MTGPELKTIIFRYLESKGWKNKSPNEYYGWDAPASGQKDRIDHYCWHAAVAVQISTDEGKAAKIPGGTVGPELVRR